MSNDRGYTLIECLVSLAVVGLLSAVALPAFQGIKHRLSNQAERHHLLLVLNLARSLAVKEQVTLTLCPTAEGKRCSQNWQRGYLLFRNPEKSPQPQQIEDVLYTVQLKSTNLLEYNQGTRVNFLGQSQLGLSVSPFGHFRHCGLGEKQVSLIVINRLGRVRIAPPERFAQQSDN